jgi:predicted ABC-type transport system involved in lysophospholipase L1 biosynthesis ATPase subunit
MNSGKRLPVGKTSTVAAGRFRFSNVAPARYALTPNLDSVRAHELLALLREMIERASLTVLMVTHDRELAARFASRLVYMKDGAIISDSRTAPMNG